MGNLYNTISALCEKRGITAGKMCNELGLSRGMMTDLKMGRKKTINAITANKIASYFNVSVSYLLGEEQKQKTPTLTKKDERTVTDDDIKFALFGDTDIDDDVFDSVKNFAKFAAEQRKKNKEGE